MTLQIGSMNIQGSQAETIFLGRIYRSEKKKKEKENEKGLFLIFYVAQL